MAPGTVNGYTTITEWTCRRAAWRARRQRKDARCRGSNEGHARAPESAGWPSLVDLDLLASGTDGLKDAVDQVSDDVDALRDSASDAAADDVDALEAAVGALGDSISALGDDLSGANVGAVGESISEVSAAAQAVISTLADC